MIEIKHLVIDCPIHHKGTTSGNLIKTDSLKVYAGPDKTYGVIDLVVEKYLYADLQSRKRLVVNYRSEG